MRYAHLIHKSVLDRLPFHVIKSIVGLIAVWPSIRQIDVLSLQLVSSFLRSFSLRDCLSHSYSRVVWMSSLETGKSRLWCTFFRCQISLNSCLPLDESQEILCSTHGRFSYPLVLDGHQLTQSSRGNAFQPFIYS